MKLSEVIGDPRYINETPENKKYILNDWYENIKKDPRYTTAVDPAIRKDITNLSGFSMEEITNPPVGISAMPAKMSVEMSKEARMREAQMKFIKAARAREEDIGRVQDELLKSMKAPGKFVSFLEPYVKGTLGFFTRPFKKDPIELLNLDDVFGDLWEEKNKIEHPFISGAGGMAGEIAPFIIGNMVMPGSGLLSATAVFGATGGIKEYGRQQMEEGLIPTSTAEERAVAVGKAMLKTAAYAPIWYYSSYLRFIGKGPLLRTVKYMAGRAAIRGAGAFTLSSVFGDDLESAVREGGIMTGLSLIFELPQLANTPLGMKVVKSAERQIRYGKMQLKYAGRYVKDDVRETSKLMSQTINNLKSYRITKAELKAKVKALAKAPGEYAKNTLTQSIEALGESVENLRDYNIGKQEWLEMYSPKVGKKIALSTWNDMNKALAEMSPEQYISPERVTEYLFGQMVHRPGIVVTKPKASDIVEARLSDIIKIKPDTASKNPDVVTRNVFKMVTDLSKMFWSGDLKIKPSDMQIPKEHIASMHLMGIPYPNTPEAGELLKKLGIPSELIEAMSPEQQVEYLTDFTKVRDLVTELDIIDKKVKDKDKAKRQAAYNLKLQAQADEMLGDVMSHWRTDIPLSQDDFLKEVLRLQGAKQPRELIQYLSYVKNRLLSKPVEAKKETIEIKSKARTPSYPIYDKFKDRTPREINETHLKDQEKMKDVLVQLGMQKANIEDAIKNAEPKEKAELKRQLAVANVKIDRQAKAAKFKWAKWGDDFRAEINKMLRKNIKGIKASEINAIVDKVFDTIEGDEDSADTPVQEILKMATEEIYTMPEKKGLKEVKRFAPPKAEDEEVLITTKKSLENILLGDASQAFSTNSNDVFVVRYALTELDSLKASHNPDYTPKEDYIWALQARGKGEDLKPADRLAIDEIVKHFKPELLLNKPQGDLISQGSLVITPEGYVLAGNGRWIVLNKISEADYKKYKDYLKDSLGQFGIDPSFLSEFKNPVLVRIVEPKGFKFYRKVADDSNRSNERGMTTVSQAQQNTKIVEEIAPSLVSEITDFEQIPNSLNVKNPKYAEFVKRFIDGLGRKESIGFINEDGSLSQEGDKAIKAALLNYIFNDPKMIDAIVNSRESISKRVDNAILDNIPAILYMKFKVPENSKIIIAQIRESWHVYNDAKQAGKSVADTVRQGTMFVKSSEAANKLALYYELGNRSESVLRIGLRTYIKIAAVSPDADESVLFEESRRTNYPKMVQDAFAIALPQDQVFRTRSLGAAASIEHIAQQTEKNLAKYESQSKIIEVANEYLKVAGENGVLSGDYDLFGGGSIMANIEKIFSLTTPTELEVYYETIYSDSIPRPQRVALKCALLIQERDLKNKIKSAEKASKAGLTEDTAIADLLKESPTSIKGMKNIINKLAYAYHTPRFHPYKIQLRERLFNILGGTRYLGDMVKSTLSNMPGVYSHADFPTIVDDSKQNLLTFLVEHFDKYNPSKGPIEAMIEYKLRRIVMDTASIVNGVKPSQYQKYMRVKKWIQDYKSAKRTRVEKGELPADTDINPTLEEIRLNAIKEREMSEEEARSVIMWLNTKFISLNEKTNLEEDQTWEDLVPDEHLGLESSELTVVNKYLDAVRFRIGFTDSEFTLYDAMMREGLDAEGLAKKLNIPKAEAAKKINDIVTKIKHYVKYEDPELLNLLNDVYKKIENKNRGNMAFYSGIPAPSIQQMDNIVKNFISFIEEHNIPVTKWAEGTKGFFMQFSRVMWLAELNPTFRTLMDEVIETAIELPAQIRHDYTKPQMDYISALDVAVQEMAPGFSPKKRNEARKRIEGAVHKLLVQSKLNQAWLEDEDFDKLGDEGVKNVHSIKMMYKALKEMSAVVTQVMKQLMTERMGLNNEKYQTAFVKASEVTGFPVEMLKVRLSVGEVLATMLARKDAFGGDIDEIEQVAIDLQEWYRRHDEVEKMFENFHDGYWAFNRNNYDFVVTAQLPETKSANQQWELYPSAMNSHDTPRKPTVGYYSTFKTKREMRAKVEELKRRGYRDVKGYDRTFKIEDSSLVRSRGDYVSLNQLFMLEEEYEKKRDMFNSGERDMRDAEREVFSILESVIKDRLTAPNMKRFYAIEGWHDNMGDMFASMAQTLDTAIASLTRAKMVRQSKPHLDAMKKESDGGAVTIKKWHTFTKDWLKTYLYGNQSRKLDLINGFVYTYFIGPKISFPFLQATQNFIFGAPAIAKWLVDNGLPGLKSDVEASRLTTTSFPYAIEYMYNNMFVSSIKRHILFKTVNSIPSQKKRIAILEEFDKTGAVSDAVLNIMPKPLANYLKKMRPKKSRFKLADDEKAVLDQLISKGLGHSLFTNMMIGVRADTLQRSTRESVTAALNMASSLSEITNRVLLSTTMVRAAKMYDMPALSPGKGKIDKLDYKAFEQEVETAMYTAHFLFSKLNNPVAIEGLGKGYALARVLYIFMSFAQDAIQFNLNNAIKIAENSYTIGASGGDMPPIERALRYREIKAAVNASLTHGIWLTILGGVTAYLPYILLSKIWKYFGRSLNQDVMNFTYRTLHLPPKIILAILDGWTNLAGISVNRSVAVGLNKPAIVGLFNNWKKGIKMWSEGSLAEAAPYLVPVFAGAVIKGLVYHNRGIQRRNGELMSVPIQQQILKSLAFSTSVDSAVRYTDYDPLIKEYFATRRNFAKRYANAEFKGDNEEMIRIREEIADYNQRQAHEEYMISPWDAGFRTIVENQIKKDRGIVVRDINKRFRARRKEREEILLK